ncbi:MAG: hypothetical protein KBC84_06105, partial [Proteobacteria bacterium]|nr:hypothetical protein [Pseudomonadota bacterium]
MKMQYRKISLFILCILIQNEVLTAVAANTKPVKISASNYFTTQNDKYGKVSCIKMNGDAYAGTVKSKKKFYLASNTLNSLKADLAKALKKKKKNQAKIDKLTNQVNAKQLEVTELNQICHNVMFPPSDGSPNPTPTPEPDEPDLSDPDDYNSLEPLSRPITSEDVRYLGEKAGFGFSSREEYLTSIGVNQGVAALVENFMNTRAEDSGLMDRVNDLLDGDVGRTTTQSAYGQRAALMELQTHTNNPYAERFALFLLSVWTVSG